MNLLEYTFSSAESVIPSMVQCLGHLYKDVKYLRPPLGGFIDRGHYFPVCSRHMAMLSLEGVTLVPNVFVVSKSYHDYSAAEEYGKLIYLAEAPINKFSTSAMVRLCEESFKDSKPSDYILVAGPQIMGIVATNCFMQMHGRLNLLLYKASPKGDRYLARTIKLSESEKENGSST